MFSKISIISLIFSLAFCHALLAQKSSKLQMEVGASLNGGLYEEYPVWGYGGYGKLLWTIGRKGNALITGIDFSRLHERYYDERYAYNYLLSSFGFRKIRKSFFVEFKAGIGAFNDEDYFSPCVFIGIEPGIQKDKLIFSLDYRFLTSEGLIDGSYFNTVALKFSYKIMRNKNN